MPFTGRLMHPRWILLIAMTMAVAVYWLGLAGPFILDDPWNLEPIRLWQAGQASLREVFFPNESIVFSRPVAMGSFALTTWLFGDTTFSFKLGNLIVHLGCGWLCWLVLRRVLARDTRLAPHAELLAALATSFWLLHPLHVSTVLYTVQRMAQLSTFFTLAAVWFYLVARDQLIEGRLRPALVNLFIAFPLMMLLGVLSKQNAVVAPALCLVFELAYFLGQPRNRRAVAVFFGLFLAIPTLAGIALLAFAPNKLLSTYSEWDFSMGERLLTQPRVLVDYIGMLLIPRGPLMGLYTDDFAFSTGLFSPISTLICIAALIAASLAAIALRKRAPSFFAGWFFFLAAHSVESTFLPLEMYFEHRNYLPSIGFILAAVSLTALLPKIRTNVLSLRQLGLVAAGSFAAVLCVATFGRVLIWQSMEGILQQALNTHPNSLRARFDMSAWALGRGDYDRGIAAMQYLAQSEDARHRQLGNLSLVAINCMRGSSEGSLGYLKLAASENLPRLTTFEAQSFIRIGGASRESGCGNISDAELARYLKQILDSAQSQPETAAPKWFSRNILAELYARSGQWPEALEQAKLAWAGGHDKKIGVFLAILYVRNGNLPAAKILLKELEAKIEPYDKQGQQALSELRELLAGTRSFVNP